MISIGIHAIATAINGITMISNRNMGILSEML